MTCMHIGGDGGVVVLLSVRSDNFITRICVQDTLDTFMLRSGYVMLRSGYVMLRACYVLLRSGYVPLRSGYVLLRKKPTE